MTLEELQTAAEAVGLSVALGQRTSPTGDLHIISVGRPREAGQWSLEPTEIAAAKDLPIALDRARDALSRMEPRLRKILAGLPEPPPPEESLTLSAGVSSEGVVTTLRVERDGSVRLAREDIEAIAEAVYRLLHPKAKP